MAEAKVFLCDQCKKERTVNKKEGIPQGWIVGELRVEYSLGEEMAKDKYPVTLCSVECAGEFAKKEFQQLKRPTTGGFYKIRLELKAW